MPPKPPARTTDRRRGQKTPQAIKQPKKTTKYNDPFGRNEVPSSETNAMYQRIFNDRRGGR